jgi:hypothetical protein
MYVVSRKKRYGVGTWAQDFVYRSMPSPQSENKKEIIEREAKYTGDLRELKSRSRSDPKIGTWTNIPIPLTQFS